MNLKKLQAMLLKERGVMMENTRYKFRAWYKEGGYMMPVEEIDFKQRLINKSGIWRWFHEVDLMQYTGLKDKNGVEIFEGDIVRFTNSIDEVDNEVGKVIWEQSECNFVAQYKTTNRVRQEENGTTITIYLISNETYREDIEYEVIGNIYQNKDLLEG